MADQNVFNLGEHGVDLVAGPLHAKDGSLARAQNAEFFLDRGKGCIRQRPPLRRLSATQASGGYGAGPIPLGDPFGYALYLQQHFGTTWRSSTDDGATWAAVTGSNKPAAAELPSFGTNHYVPVRPLRIGRTAYYHYLSVGSGFSDNGVGAYDGVRSVGLGIGPTISDPGSTRVTNPTQLHGTIYVARNAWDSRTWAVYSVDPETGELSRLPLPYIGSDADSTYVSTGVEEVPQRMVSHLGKLWLLTQRDSSGVLANRKSRVLSARIGDTAWVEELAIGSINRWYFDAVVYRGNLYVASEASGAESALVEQRTPAGVWTTSLTSANFPGTAHALGGLIVYKDELYAVEYRTTSISQTMVVHKYNGTAWSVDDSFTCGSGSSGNFPVACVTVAGQSLFISGLFGTRRKTAGTWSALTTGITGVNCYLLGV